MEETFQNKTSARLWPVTEAVSQYSFLKEPRITPVLHAVLFDCKY